MSLMLKEVLEAQNRNADYLKLDNKELNRIQKKVKFRFARDFLQRGNKADAIKNAFGNFAGANSASELVQFGARIFVPFSVVKLRRKFLQKQMQERFGNSLLIE
jgi:hypothetical protein